MNYLDANFIAALHFNVAAARTLAASARLKVFPNLVPAEKAKVVR